LLPFPLNYLSLEEQTGNRFRKGGDEVEAGAGHGEGIGLSGYKGQTRGGLEGDKGLWD